MLKILYGTADADKIGCLFEKVNNNVINKVKSYILVPEQFSVFTERRVIKSLGVSAEQYVEVLTFSRLGNEVLGALGPLRLNYIDGAGKEILAGRALQNIEGSLKYLKSNVHQRGFSSILVNLVSEFKRYGLTDEKINDTCQSIKDDDLRLKLQDIALFYKTYQALIEKKNSDAEDNLSLILPKIKDFDIPNSSELFVTEFKSFTPLEHDILSELMKKVKNTSVILSCDNPKEPSDIFATSANTYRKICENAETIGVECAKPEKIDLHKTIHEDISYIQNNYFDLSAGKFRKTPSHIHIIKPKDYYDEVEQAAEIIHKLCREENYSQSDFLILARDTEQYNRIMPLVFSKYGINIFLDKRRTIMNNPYLHCISNVLEILSYGFSYERVMSVARSGFSPDVTDEEIDIFDNYLLAVNPSHAMWNDEKDWTFNPDIKTYDMEVVNKAKNGIMKPIYGIKAHIKGRKTVDEIVNVIFEFISNSNHELKMKKICDDYSKQGMIYLAEEYRRVWNGVISILTRMSEIMENEEITYQKFTEIFVSSCNAVKVGISPQSIDGAVFSSIDLFRNTDAKAVIVLGMNYDVFPKGYSAEGLITDSERMVLRDLGISLAMTAEEKSDDEQLLIYNVLSSASDNLYLSCPKSTNMGKRLEPSKIISRLENELFDFPDDTNRADCVSESPDVIFESVNQEIVSEKGDTNLLSEKYSFLYKYFAENEKYSKKLEDFSKRLYRASLDYEEISKEVVESLYGKDILLSATKLEKFNSCAFSYFMRYGLLAMPRDVAGMNPIGMGNILHKTLEMYFAKNKDVDVDYEKIERSVCEKEIYDIVKETAKSADEVMYQNSAYYKYLIMRISGIAATTAWETIKFYQNSKFRPFGFEIKIGKNGDFPPLKIQTDLGKASVEGFVDRVDIAEIEGEKYISIVDYKSSVRDLNKFLAEDGVHFQPLIYANAICNDGGVNPAAMLYQRMNDPIVSEDDAKSTVAYEKAVHKEVKPGGWVISDDEIYNAFDSTNSYMPGKNNVVPKDEMNERLKAAEEKINETARNIFSGKISIDPYNKYGFDSCQYCDYKNICRNK